MSLENEINILKQDQNKYKLAKNPPRRFMIPIHLQHRYLKNDDSKAVIIIMTQMIKKSCRVPLPTTGAKKISNTTL